MTPALTPYDLRRGQGSWEGVQTLSPFRYPLTVSLVTVAVSEPDPLNSAWRHYHLSGPSVDADTVIHKLHMRLSRQSNTLPAIKLEAEQVRGDRDWSVAGWL